MPKTPLSLLLILLGGCQCAAEARSAGTTEPGVLGTGVGSTTGDAQGSCAPVHTPEDLEATLPGTWVGDVYNNDFVATGRFEFGPGGAFRYVHPGDGGVEERTCDNVDPVDAGQAWRVLGPTLVLVTAQNSNAGACGDAEAYAAISDIWITEDCRLTATLPSSRVWDRTAHTVVELYRE